MAYRVVWVDGPSGSLKGLIGGLEGSFLRLDPAGGLGPDRILGQKPDLLLLPVLLDRTDGIAVLRELRASPLGQGLPVLVVGDRRGEEDAVAALQLAADDYVHMPADPRELEARVRAVLRRRYAVPEQMAKPLRLGELELDPSSRRCRIRGRAVALRPSEFSLLETLMRKAGRVLSREYLLEVVWHTSPLVTTRSVDVMVSRLRGKLGARAGRRIQTVRQYGYLFDENRVGRKKGA